MTHDQKAAKRIVAELCLQRSVDELKKLEPTGGPRSASFHSQGIYRTVEHLARHAAEQIRLAEGIR